jgi:hypothetical protein
MRENFHEQKSETNCEEFKLLNIDKKIVIKIIIKFYTILC